MIIILMQCAVTRSIRKISQIMLRECRLLLEEKNRKLKAYGAAEEMSSFCEHDSRQTNALYPFSHPQPHAPVLRRAPSSVGLVLTAMDSSLLWFGEHA